MNKTKQAYKLLLELQDECGCACKIGCDTWVFEHDKKLQFNLSLSISNEPAFYEAGNVTTLIVILKERIKHYRSKKWTITDIVTV